MAIAAQIVYLMLLSACFSVLAWGQTSPSSPTTEASLKEFLQSYVKRRTQHENKTTRYKDVFVDLNDDGQAEAVVYLTGGGWCGSGGCNTLILSKTDSSFNLVTNITISRPPVRVLTSTSHGWHDLSVWVQGGGVLPGYEAELRFDGSTYPPNPSKAPAIRLSMTATGRVVVSSAQQGRPLFP
jgi:hypothetical protein